MNYRQFFSALFAVLISGLSTFGHESPSHVVKGLTDRIRTEGGSANLLIARAYEHQSLGNWKTAVVDYRAALEFEPRSKSAISGCAEALMHMNAFPEAESMARRGVALDEDPALQVIFHALLGSVFSQQYRWREALEAWRFSLQSPHPEIDWFLGEAECLARLGRHLEQVGALAQAMTRNPSVVLRRAWIHALVDAGEFETALPEIERNIASSRWKSSWLLLRARVHEQHQLYTEQQADSWDALLEIRTRLSPDRPDPYLVLEAAQAHAFLGEREEAISYLKMARELGVSEIQLTVVKQTVAGISRN